MREMRQVERRVRMCGGGCEGDGCGEQRKLSGGCGIG